MPITIDGTNGISNVQSTTDGSAATPAIRGTDTNTGIFFPAADTIAFSEGGTEAMRINSAGDVGIGTSSPVSIGGGYIGATVNGSNGSGITLQQAGTTRGSIFVDSNGLQYFAPSTNPQLFYTNGTERMRITSGGALLVGTTAGSGNLVLNNKNGNDFSFGFNLQKNGNGTPNYEFVVGGDNKLYLGYSATATPTAVGNFATNGTYTATSDIRKKKDISYAFNGLSIVSQLKPVQGRMLDDEESSPLRPMFIAQDMVDVLPSVVSSIEPSPNTDNPILGIDYASIVPVLCKAIQELKATVDAQAARIAALEV
jgi:hypothetical protein